MKFRKIYKCSCYSHALSFDVENEAEGFPTEFTFSLWWSNLQHTMDWKQRVRWCWRILTTGDPWGDLVILDRDDVVDLRDSINKALKYKHPKKCKS